MDLEHPMITEIRRTGYPEGYSKKISMDQVNVKSEYWDPIEWMKEQKLKNANKK